MSGDSLVLELQRLAQESNTGISELLLRAKTLASKLDQDDARLWIEHELGGYPLPSELPQYRVVPSELQVRNPYHGWNAVAWGGEGGLQRHFETTEVRQAIAEIEAAAGGSDPIHFSLTQAEMNALLAGGNDVFAQLPAARVASHASFAGILAGTPGTPTEGCWGEASERAGEDGPPTRSVWRE